MGTRDAAPAGKFTQFNLDQDDPHIPELAAILKDLDGRPSILDMLRFYQSELVRDASPGNPYLSRLAWLFAHGKPVELNGHHYGITLVMKQGDSPLGGMLNALWGNTVGPVSPWAGKTFTPASQAAIRRYTGGADMGGQVVYRGINCFSRVAGSLWNAAGIEFMTFWVGLKEAPKSEQTQYGYERKGGLFTAHKAESVNPGNPGKTVLRLNYRWPKLGNPPPLCYLIDELVGIADGLYLGQLLFASDILTEYDPARPSSDYAYAHYGYFLLMDESWYTKGEQA